MPGNILLLQGPMGPFFRRLAQDLEQATGASVYKINLNAGDWLFYRGPRAVSFSGTPEQWPQFLADRISEWNIGRIYLFGDTRHYHRVARHVAVSMSVPISVFEEGYLRPHYITLEEGGVNCNSSLPANADFYREVQVPPEPKSEVRDIRHGYGLAAWYATWYYIFGWLGQRWFPHYRHHRPFVFYDEAFLWCRAAYRKYKYRWQQRGVLKQLSGSLSGNYYLVPLQVHCDGQIRDCEHVASAASFVRRVISSFARNAPAGTALVLKHHPLDRGYSDYSKLVRRLAHRCGVMDRVIYVHDLHLPTLLEHAIGTVVVNSTAGLSSLLHGAPVKALGQAIYNLPGLTFQGSLDSFWADPGKVDQKLNQKFRAYLAATSQLNGSFYSRPAGMHSATGLDIRCLLRASGWQSQLAVVSSAAPGADVIPVEARPVPARVAAAATPARQASYGGRRARALAAQKQVVE